MSFWIWIQILVYKIKFEDFDFADDLALLTSTFHEIQQKLPKLKEITRQDDLRINKEKAKVMRQM